MFKRKNNKKGFTVVELTIVVSVIAILSAVLIPTFASITKKARQTADQQAVNTLNKTLALEADNKPEDITEVIKLMAENNYDVEDYKPLIKDNFFYWVESENAIVIADETNKVLYPAQYTDLTYTKNNWWTLTGKIEEDDSWTVNTDGLVEVDTAGKLVSLMDMLSNNKKKADKVTEIKLTDDIDMKGSTQNFNVDKLADWFNDIVFDGNDKTISNYRIDKNSQLGDFSGTNTTAYGYGFFGTIPLGCEVTVKNVTFSNVFVGDTADYSTTSMFGVIAGNVKGSLTIENVTIKDCTLTGEKKVGAAVGYVGKDSSTGTTECKLVINGLNVENVKITAAFEGAQVVGFVDENKVDEVSVTTSTLNVKNVTLTEDKTLTAETNSQRTGLHENHYVTSGTSSEKTDDTGANW